MTTPFNSFKFPSVKTLTPDKITFADQTEMTSADFLQTNFFEGGYAQSDNTTYFGGINEGDPNPVIDETQGTPFADDLNGSLHTELKITVTNHDTVSRKVLICANIIGDFNFYPYNVNMVFWRGNGTNGYGSVLTAPYQPATQNIKRVLSVFNGNHHNSNTTGHCDSTFTSYIDTIGAGSTVSYCPVLTHERGNGNFFRMNRVRSATNNQLSEYAVSNMWAIFLE